MFNEEQQEIMDGLKAEVKGLYAKSEKKNAELAEQVEEFKKQKANSEDLTLVKTIIDTQKDDLKKLYDTLDKVEAKMAKGGQVGASSSIGDMILKSKGFEGIAAGQKGTWEHTVEAKDITNLGNTQASPNRNVLVPEMTAPFVNPIDQPLSIRSLIPAGQTSSDVIQRAEEENFINNADMVAEGALKPESSLTFKRGSIQVEKIAHWIRTSAEVLSDAHMLKSYIEKRLKYGVDFKEERALLTGNGTSPQLDGLLNTGNYLDYDNTHVPGIAPVDGIDDIRIAKEQVNSQFLSATGVIMNYRDWAKFELTRDEDGKYLYASVTNGFAPRVWGMKVALSHSIETGKFHVGAYSMGAMIWDRWAMRCMASTEDGDNFRNNKVTILAEKRLALEIYRKNAFVYGSFTAPAAA